MSRLVLLIISLVAGAVLAVGASVATSALVSTSSVPSNQAPYNYGNN